MRKKKKRINNFERSSIDYFKEINSFSPLKREEELSLWEQYKKNNDLSARDKIIKANLKFVASVAKPYIGMGLSYSDLIAEGNIGLIKAMERFDYRKGYKTISYSVWWIRQTIIEALKKRNIYNYDELPLHFEDDENEKDEKKEKDSDCHNENLIVNFNFDEIKNAENSEMVSKLMESLSEREKFVITCYFGIGDNDELTLDEIGDILDLTKERVRQIKECALKKLRTEALTTSFKFESKF